MYIMKIRPSFKDYHWGGDRLIKDLGMKSNQSHAAEAWVLSAHPDGDSYIENGQFAGLSFYEMLKKAGKKILGTNCQKFDRFPLLIKLIDASKDLSVQVHPSDDYALSRENRLGNTKTLYIIDNSRGAYLYYGFKEKISKQEFEDRINNGTLTEVLNKVKVKKGDCFFVKPGTVHAIGAGILLAEIQQNSTCTYKVFDYDRVDSDGSKSPLQTKNALEVTDTEPSKNPIIHKSTKTRLHLANCDYFVTDRIFVKGEFNVISDISSFVVLLITEGTAVINGIEGKSGDCFFVPAGFGRVNITGECTLLESRV